MQNGFGIVRVLDLGGNAKNVSALADVVLDVFVVALVCELSHFNPRKRHKLRIQFDLILLLTFQKRTVRRGRRGRGWEGASL